MTNIMLRYYQGIELYQESYQDYESGKGTKGTVMDLSSYYVYADFLKNSGELKG